MNFKHLAGIELARVGFLEVSDSGFILAADLGCGDPGGCGSGQTDLAARHPGAVAQLHARLRGFEQGLGKR